MLIEKGEWEISDVVVSLGDILKYSLHGEEMLVLFEEELKYIESYLCIQKNRLEDRLTVQIEIDEEAKLCFVPKLWRMRFCMELRRRRRWAESRFKRSLEKELLRYV